MATNKNLTVFQRLGQILGPDAATKTQIKQIIKEELEQVMNEVELEEQEALQEEADASAKQELIDALSQPMK